MIKRTIKETVNEYDKDGNLVKQTVTETTEDDDAQYVPYNPWGYTFVTSTDTNQTGEV